MSRSHQPDSNEQEKKNDHRMCNSVAVNTNAAHGLCPEGYIEDEIRLKRKLDMRIIPAMVLFCILSFVDELSLRTAILSSAALISYAFGSLFAAGILGTMDDVLGITAWRWLFFIEGSVTIFFALICMYAYSNKPNNTRWLTAEQRHLAQVRVAEDVGEADADASEVKIFEGLILAMKDPKVYLFILLLFSEALGASFVNFFPTFTSTFGYSTTVTLLISAPPWIVPAIVNLFNAWHADRTGERFFHLVIWWGVAIIGYIIALSTMETAPRYFSLYLMTLGYTGLVLSVVWVANTIPRPPSKRAAAISLVTGIGGTGSVAGSYIWKASWGPQYRQTLLITSCTYASGAIAAFIIRYLLMRENERMEQLEIDTMESTQLERIEKAAELEGITVEEAVTRRKGFRYLH
ncbi:hypothetical protein ID866_8959 [Astraeus odoratus]|nr:hypothetical protein ID866_8959 [Astraeus odoratus]